MMKRPGITCAVLAPASADTSTGFGASTQAANRTSAPTGASFLMRILQRRKVWGFRANWCGSVHCVVAVARSDGRAQPQYAGGRDVRKCLWSGLCRQTAPSERLHHPADPLSDEIANS